MRSTQRPVSPCTQEGRKQFVLLPNYRQAVSFALTLQKQLRYTYAKTRSLSQQFNAAGFKTLDPRYAALSHKYFNEIEMVKVLPALTES